MQTRKLKYKLISVEGLLQFTVGPLKVETINPELKQLGSLGGRGQEQSSA
jgi:hypothetical protein